jgi:hypothetical protein
LKRGPEAREPFFRDRRPEILALPSPLSSGLAFFKPFLGEASGAHPPLQQIYGLFLVRSDCGNRKIAEVFDFIGAP